MAPILVTPYDPTWPTHFQRISSQLATYLTTSTPPVPYTTVEHIGSTSIPHLAAKPNIDIVILVADAATAERARDALIWQPPPTEYYKCIGHGGIKGRISMKFEDWEALPQRSVYIISEDDEDGMLGLRGYRDLKRVLMGDDEEAGELRREYEDVKWRLVEEGVEDVVEYGRRKNGVVRRILRRAAGWSEEEVDRKEALDVRVRWESWEL